MTIRFLDAAELELDEAVAYYSLCAPGLGEDFAREVQAGLGHIETYPQAWQLVGRRVRRYQLHRFP